MKVTVTLKEKLYDEEEMIKCTIQNTNCNFDIYVDENNSLENQLSQKENIKKAFDLGMKSLKNSDNQYNLQQYYIIAKINKNLDKLNDLIEVICFECKDGNKILRYIEESEFIRSKKIRLLYPFPANEYEKIIELNQILADYRDIVYIRMQGNSDFEKLSDCNNSVIEIKEIAEDIKSLKLSPMETIMYVYDFARNRKYKRENSNEKENVSRDINSVLNGDKIVCQGYSNLFDSILGYMGFDSNIVFLGSNNIPSNIGHTRNLVYIKDEKYNIDGVYYFDTTWESKGMDFDSEKNHDENEFLNKYLYFAKTKRQIEEIDKENKKHFIEDKYQYLPKDIIESIIQLINEDELQKLEKYEKSINYMAKMVFGKPLLKIDWIKFPEQKHLFGYNKEEIITKLKKIQEKYDKPIPGETYIKVLNNVRIAQNFKKMFSYYNNIYKTYLDSKWELSKFDYSIQDIMMNVVLENDKNRSQKRTYYYFNNCGEQSKMAEEMIKELVLKYNLASIDKESKSKTHRL